MAHTNNNHSSTWNFVYKLGGWAAIGTVLVGVTEIAITFLPGGNTPHETVLDWFRLYQENPFMGLRNLGLLNIFLNSLGILTYFALYAAHRETQYQPQAAIIAIVFFLGVGVFLATNRAFPMLALSRQYAQAATDAQRAILEATGQSMLSVGQSHTPGTFLAFFLTELAGTLISVVMLRSQVFAKTAAYAGIVGFSMLMIFEFISSFLTGLSSLTMLLAIIGGISSMVWNVLNARRLFELSKG